METSAGVNALTIVFAALCVFAIAYRFYGLFLAQKVLSLDAARQTPAVRQADGKDYVATDRYVLFGHHFAAIAAAGPLLGPVLAAQFGYMPGLLWILIGCVLAGGVHDMVVLFCSVRHRGRSLAYIASTEVDKRTGFVALQEAAAYTAELRGIEMEMPERITCHYFHRNRECLRAGCPFFGR